MTELSADRLDCSVLLPSLYKTLLNFSIKGLLVFICEKILKSYRIIASQHFLSVHICRRENFKLMLFKKQKLLWVSGKRLFRDNEPLPTKRAYPKYSVLIVIREQSGILLAILKAPHRL